MGVASVLIAIDKVTRYLSALKVEFDFQSVAAQTKFVILLIVFTGDLMRPVSECFSLVSCLFTSYVLQSRLPDGNDEWNYYTYLTYLLYIMW